MRAKVNAPEGNSGGNLAVPRIAGVFARNCISVSFASGPEFYSGPPITPRGSLHCRQSFHPRHEIVPSSLTPRGWLRNGAVPRFGAWRSEERRVGKESR